MISSDGRDGTDHARVSWFGNFLRWCGRLETSRWFLWGTFLAFPTGFIAIHYA